MARIDWAEARRYLGLHRPGGVVDEALEQLLERWGRELEQTARPRAVWRRFPLQLEADGTELAGMSIPSRHLRRHLNGCTGAYLFAATLGAEVDRLIRRCAVTEVSAAVVCQACAASLLEAYCDECGGRIAGEVAEEGLWLRPRFSPGYGDVSVDFQPALLAALEAQKRIGLTASQARMLIPTKSVTAVIGLSPDPTCRPGGCASCGKTDCAFRRTDVTPQNPTQGS